MRAAYWVGIPGAHHYISMGRDVPTKGVLFSESVWNGDVLHCKKPGKGFKYTCLERDSCLFGNGVVNYPSLEGNIINGMLCPGLYCLNQQYYRCIW